MNYEALKSKIEILETQHRIAGEAIYTLLHCKVKERIKNLAALKAYLELHLQAESEALDEVIDDCEEAAAVEFAVMEQEMEKILHQLSLRQTKKGKTWKKFARTLRRELRAHFSKEESQIFPLLLQSFAPPVSMAKVYDFTQERRKHSEPNSKTALAHNG